MTNMPEMIELFAEVCRRRGYRLTLLDEHSGYLAEISDGRTAFLTGAGAVSAYPLNGATMASIAADKAHTYLLARRAGFKVPTGEHFFISRRHRAQRAPGKEIFDAVRYAQDLGFPVFVKPNKGSRGIFTEIVADENDLLHHFAAMTAEFPVALVQEVLTGEEYRILVVDGEVAFLYRRRSSRLVGDGVATVAELLEVTNATLLDQGLPPVPIESAYLAHALANARLGPDSVPAKGRTIAYAARRNVSGGGEVADFTTDPPPPVRDYARRLASAVGLRVIGIDVFAATRDLDPAGFTLLEVNANPALGGAAKAGHREDALATLARICAIRFAEGT